LANWLRGGVNYPRHSANCMGGLANWLDGLANWPEGHNLSHRQIIIRDRAERGARDVGGAVRKMVHVFLGLISPLNRRSNSVVSFSSCAHCLK
jgi:hypothetical protein